MIKADKDSEDLTQQFIHLLTTAPIGWKSVRNSGWQRLASQKRQRRNQQAKYSYACVQTLALICGDDFVTVHYPTSWEHENTNGLKSPVWESDAFLYARFRVDLLNAASVG